MLSLEEIYKGIKTDLETESHLFPQIKAVIDPIYAKYDPTLNKGIDKNQFIKLARETSKVVDS